MSSVETGQMSAVETGQMSDAGTGKMFAFDTGQMSAVLRQDKCLLLGLSKLKTFTAKDFHN